MNPLATARPASQPRTTPLRVDLADTVSLIADAAQIDATLECLADEPLLAGLYATLLTALTAAGASDLAHVSGQQFELIIRTRDAVALLHALDASGQIQATLVEQLSEALAAHPTLR